MRIAICDDMGDERAQCKELLREYLRWRGVDAAVTEYDSGEALIESFTPGAFDLILLDIYMRDLDGMETARWIRGRDLNCPIIFATASAERGAEAYDVDALYYLVKPVDRSKFFHVLDRWYERTSAQRRIFVKCGRELREIAARDILYIDVQGRCSTVHTAAEVIESTMPLSAIEALLPKNDFCRSIRYCIVSLEQIRSVQETSLTLTSGASVPLSRRERENLKKMLATFRLRRLRQR